MPVQKLMFGKQSASVSGRPVMVPLTLLPMHERSVSGCDASQIVSAFGGHSPGDGTHCTETLTSMVPGEGVQAT